MRWEYDTDSGALYVYLADDRQVATQTEMPDGTIVDLDSETQVVGVEIIGISHPVNWADLVGRFVLTADQLSFLGSLNAILGSLPRQASEAADEVQRPLQPTESFAPAELVAA